MDVVRLSPDPLSVDEVTQLVGDPSCGAISLFVGTIRDNFEGKQVCRLEYEAYNKMAEKEMKKICEDCRMKWNLKNIAIYHRLGAVGVKEASMIIAVSSEHRRESLDAVSFLIDSLKASVPIWKKEVYLNDKAEWKSNKECTWAKEMPFAINGMKIKEEIMDTEDSLKTVKMEPVERDLLFIENKRELPDELDETKSIIDPTFVQIVASKEEMERRIRAFQDRKKEELNMLNIQEFCMNAPDDNEDRCARTTAIVLRSKGSNSHLKFTKVFNVWGPQMSGVDPGSFSRDDDPPMPSKGKRPNLGTAYKNSDELKLPMKVGTENFTASCPPLSGSKISEGIDERLKNMEVHLKIYSEKPIHSSVYSRLKALEDRILFLEGLSPEYFSSKATMLHTPNKFTEKRATDDDMSLEEVDAKIFALRKKLKERQLGITL